MVNFIMINTSIILMVLDKTPNNDNNKSHASQTNHNTANRDTSHRDISHRDTANRDKRVVKNDKTQVTSIHNSRSSSSNGVGVSKSLLHSPTVGGGGRLRHRKSSQMRARKMAPDGYGGVGGGGGLVRLHPAHEITFYTSTECEVLQTLTMTNTVNDTVAYKIKSTSPENFRVRPSTGAVPPGDSIEVQIYLQPGHELTAAAKDKFLIQSAIVPEQEKYDFSSLWSGISKSDILEQRLKCRYAEHPEPSQNSPSVSTGSEGRKTDAPDPYVAVLHQFQNINAKLDAVREKVLVLDHDVQKLFRIFALFLLALCVTFASLGLYIWRGSFSLK